MEMEMEMENSIEKSISTSNKGRKYKNVIDNLKEMYSVYNTTEFTLSLIAKMASMSSAIKKEFTEFTFVGFYIVVGLKCENVLEIGPYVSSILATPRISYGKGVCGTSWQNKETRIVNNVRKCDNYIACSPDVLSEIVVPVYDKNKPDEVIAVLDIDCKILDQFDETDSKNR